MSEIELKQKLLAGRAYRIFVGQLPGQMEEVRSVVESENNVPEQALKAASILHNIKGAAGVFGFTELGHIAAELEKLIKEQGGDITKFTKELDALFKSLERIVSSLPAPVSLEDNE
ncbi:MAG: hypothetical protein D6719_12150 [Candidatus Dadabacteria bacterium]|nr:MAG: hypothetical protein D6719_12150 [Candidatus Dadabacteria bacterium]